MYTIEPEVRFELTRPYGSWLQVKRSRPLSHSGIIKKVSYICLRAINQAPFGYGADSHCFSLSQSPFRCFTNLWLQSRVCHYKVFQLSIQYSHRVLRILHHLIQTQPRKLIVIILLYQYVKELMRLFMCFSFTFFNIVKF